MQPFSDKPYEFVPAKPNRLLIWLGRLANRRRLPKEPWLTRSVKVEGTEHLEAAQGAAGRRLFFLPNHPTHQDPYFIMEAYRQMRVRSCYMAAYDVFLRNSLNGWIMQRGGCFSINRDGGDSKSMREAISILTGGSYGLTIFPEGNVYLTNDRVTPFLEGAAFIGMKAQKELGDGAPICAVPVSIKATRASDQRAAIIDQLAGLATDLGTELRSEAPLIDELKRVGLLALHKNLKQRGLAAPAPDDTERNVRDLLAESSEAMLARLESKMDIEPKPTDTPWDRVRRARGRIHSIRSNPNRRIDHGAAASWADEAMLAMRILSYSGSYVDDNPTVDRFGESVEKILEDSYSEEIPQVGERHVIVRINRPINLADRLESYAKSARETVGTLTRNVEERVQSGLDQINGNNPHPGGELL